MLTLSRFQTLFWSFYCCLWTSKCWLGDYNNMNVTSTFVFFTKFVNVYNYMQLEASWSALNKTFIVRNIFLASKTSDCYHMKLTIRCNKIEAVYPNASQQKYSIFKAETRKMPACRRTQSFKDIYLCMVFQTETRKRLARERIWLFTDIYLCMIFHTKMLKWNWLPKTGYILCWHFTNSFTNNFDQNTLENGRKTHAWYTKDAFKALGAFKASFFPEKPLLIVAVELWQLKKLIVR